MEAFKNFIKKLFGSNTEVSSKRFAGIVTLANLIILAYVASRKDGVCPEYMYDALSFLCGSFFGFTSIEAIFTKRKSSDTTSV
jgi:hypothetical protein